MSNELITMENLDKKEIFKTGGAKTLVDAIKSEFKDDVADVTTEKGRAEIKSRAYLISRSSTAIDKMGKDLADELNAKLKPINNERKYAKDELKLFKEEYRKPLTDFEDAETKRVEDLETRLKSLNTDCELLTSKQVQAKYNELNDAPIDESWQEFKEKAEAVREVELDKLKMNYDYKKQKEDEAKELEQFRKEKEEREQKEREEKIKADAIEAERKRVEDEQARAVSAGFPEMVEHKDPPTVGGQKSKGTHLPAWDKDKAHQDHIDRQREEKRVINVNSMNAFIGAGFDAEKAQLIIRLIVSNKIPNVSIKYGK